jgi:hypothetical protein
LLVDKCDLFADDPGLAAFVYHLKSHVSLSDVRSFVSALEDTTVKVTNNNFKELLQLCEKFRFRELAGQALQFRESGNFTVDAMLLSALKERILAIEEEMRRGKREIASLPREISRVPESFEPRIRTEAVSANRRANEVEQHVGEVRSEVEIACTAVKQVRGLAKAAQKKATSTETRLETEVLALRTIHELISCTAS